MLIGASLTTALAKRGAGSSVVVGRPRRRRLTTSPSSKSAVRMTQLTQVCLLAAMTLTASHSTVTAIARPASRTRIHAAPTGSGYHRRRDIDGGTGGSESSAMTSTRPGVAVGQCVNTNGRCFTSLSCCRGLICADVNELHPEVPGFCVRQKQLQPCVDFMDCSPDCRCAELTAGQFYCLPAVAARTPPRASSDGQVRRHYPDVRINGGLGAVCHSSADCNQSTDDGARGLCCQLVRRGFQQPKRMCDRITTVSVCIAPPPE